MRYFNENAEPISAESLDLEKGYLVPFTTIKEDAVPIDNVTKVAWADDDYEEAQMYVLNQETDKAPTQEERIVELETMLNALLGVAE